MTNEERILALIREQPGLSDTEIRERTGITPHQQVNQITNRLAKRGLTVRTQRADGRLANYQVGSAPSPSSHDAAAPRSRPERRLSGTEASTAGRWELSPRDASTLVVIPCSKSKSHGGNAPAGPTVTDRLRDDLAEELRSCRKRNAPAARVDGTTTPAWRRYTGHLYQSLPTDVTRSWTTDDHVLIISGGYGLVLAGEPIGWYEALLAPGRWPNRLVGRCLAEYARQAGVRRVVAFAGPSTQYAAAARSAPWSAVEAWLVTPRNSGGGAMRQTSIALGQAIASFWREGLDSNWRSRDGSGLRLERLGSA